MPCKDAEVDPGKCQMLTAAIQMIATVGSVAIACDLNLKESIQADEDPMMMQ